MSYNQATDSYNCHDFSLTLSKNKTDTSLHYVALLFFFNITVLQPS